MGNLGQTDDGTVTGHLTPYSNSLHCAWKEPKEVNLFEDLVADIFEIFITFF